MNKQESKYFATASLMDEALLSLLEKKDYPFISVKEIAKKAGVNRTTFYLHYQSMDDLLQETTEMLGKRFLAAFADVDKSDAQTSVLTKEKYLLPYLNFVKQNKRVYKLVHEKPELFGNDYAFKRMYAKIFDNALKNFGVTQNDRPYVFAFYTQGTLAIVGEWLNNDCAEDVRHVAELIETHTLANETHDK